MIDCLIVGDSIAVGVAVYRPDCVSHSRGAWDSGRWNRDYLAVATSRAYRTVIVSLGANDLHVDTDGNLRRLRAALQADRVFWILPHRPSARAAIERIAAEHGDTVLSRQDVSSDGIHPTTAGYRLLAEKTK